MAGQVVQGLRKQGERSCGERLSLRKTRTSMRLGVIAISGYKQLASSMLDGCIPKAKIFPRLKHHRRRLTRDVNAAAWRNGFTRFVLRRR